MNYQIRAVGMDGANMLHAERWGPDDWRWTGPAHAGMMISTRLSLAMHLANLIGEGKVFAIDGPPDRIPFGRIMVNRLGGAVNDGCYWRFDELIESILPVEWEPR